MRCPPKFYQASFAGHDVRRDVQIEPGLEGPEVAVQQHQG